MEGSDNLKALFIIVNAGFAEHVIDIAREAGVKGATILNARGDGARHQVFMGITVDSEKELIICVADKDTSDKAMAAVTEKAGIKTPSHSVCFSMAIERAIGIGGTPLPQA